MAAALALPWALSIVSPAPLAAAGDEVAEILAAGTLAQTRNPVVANFLLEEGGPLLSASERALALEQSSTALRGQTNFMALTMQGIGGMMGLAMPMCLPSLIVLRNISSVQMPVPVC